MYSQEALLDLVGEIYESALEPQLWPNVLERIASLIQGQATVLMARDSIERTPRVTHAVRVDSALEREYNDYYAARNIWVIRGSEYLRSGRVFTGEMVCSKAEFEATEYYQDFLRRLKISHSIAGTFTETGRGDQLLLSTTGLTRRGPFGQAEVELIQLLLPHFRRSLQLHWRMDSLAEQRNDFRSALDCLSCGCVLIGAGGKAFHLNRAAERMIRAGDGLTLANGTLSAVDTREARRLRSILAAVTETGLRREISVGKPIAISRSSLKRAYVVLVVPITTPEYRLAKGRVAAAAFISDPEDTVPDLHRTLCDLFGLTKAEARLARALVTGGGLKLAAESVGISLNTAKTHLRHIFEKTNTRRQAELVRLLIAGPVALGSPLSLDASQKEI